MQTSQAFRLYDLKNLRLSRIQRPRDALRARNRKKKVSSCGLLLSAHVKRADRELIERLPLIDGRLDEECVVRLGNLSRDVRKGRGEREPVLHSQKIRQVVERLCPRRPVLVRPYVRRDHGVWAASKVMHHFGSFEERDEHLLGKAPHERAVPKRRGGLLELARVLPALSEVERVAHVPGLVTRACSRSSASFRNLAGSCERDPPPKTWHSSQRRRGLLNPQLRYS